MEYTEQEAREAHDELAALTDRRAVQIVRWLNGKRRRPPEIEGQTAIPTPRPELCPECREVVCDADCQLAVKMGWPTEVSAQPETVDA